MSNKLTFFVLMLLALSCSNDDAPVPDPIINESFFTAFTMSNPHSEVLHEPVNNLLVVMDRIEGNIVSYDYENHEVVASIAKENFITDYPMCIYGNQSKSELYIANGKTIQIYDVKTLAITDSISIFDSNDPRVITSIVCPNDDILIVGLCNSGSQSGKEGSVSIDKNTKSIIAQADFGDNCLRLRCYRQSTNTVGVIGIGSATSHPRITHDVYMKNGELLENNIEFFPSETTSKHLLKVPDASNYFITSEEGNIFNKSNFEFIHTLNKECNDFVISEDEQNIFCLSRNGEIEVVNYQTLAVEEVIPLEAIPQRGFLFENKILVVFFERDNQTNEFDIKLSILEL